jgi:streptogramin lyase
VVSSRYTAALAPALAAGWSLERMTPPSRLHGANGLRTGPDGRVYVAQVVGSQISAIDLNSGEIETISAMGSDIVGPDDLPRRSRLREGRVGRYDRKWDGCALLAR